MKILWLASLFFASFLQAETSALFIGNSYSAQIRKTFTNLIKHEKRPLHVEFKVPGGWALTKHLKDPKTTELIKSRQWTYVVLQEQSQTPAYSNLRVNFFNASKELAKIIKRQKATPLFYMTWGRRDGDKQNIKVAPTYFAMQKLLTEAYTQAAKENKSALAPVGLTWQEVRKQAPELGKQLYKKDGSHPSEQGAYLASLIIYCKLLNLTPDKISYRANLSDAEINVIKDAAKKFL
jgi:hypothetical protein